MTVPAQHSYTGTPKEPGLLSMRGSQNWLRRGTTWLLLCPGRPDPVEIHLRLVKGDTRTNTKRTVVTMNTLQIGYPSKGFNFPLSSCLLARGKRKLCLVGHPGQTWMLGWASLLQRSNLPDTGDRHPSPHQDTLLDHPQVATGSFWFSTACPAFQ